MGQEMQRQPGGRVPERRTAPRVGVEFWVEECCHDGVYFHRVTNLSRDGFFVEKKLPFQVGQTVHIRLELPGIQNKLDARSRVVANYRDGQAALRGAGFQFLELDQRTRAGIAAYIDQVRQPQ